MIDWLGELLNNILLVVFLIILFGTFIYIASKSIKKVLDIKKEKWEQKRACDKAKKEDRWRRLTDYFWANPWWFVVISLGFFMLYTLSLFLYEETGIWLFIFIFSLYISFALHAIFSYIDFPKIAAERLKEHEDAVTANVCKEITEHTQKINEFLSNYSLDNIDYSGITFDCKSNMIKHPTGVEKFDFPPFIKLDGPKKSVIKARALQFFVLERDFMLACLGAAKFDLLYPPRADAKKKCALKRAAGKCFDIFYSEIKKVVYEDGGIKIYFWEQFNKEPVIMKVAKEEDAKPGIFMIRERIRLLERQRLNKIAEVLHFERLSDKNLKVEVVNEVKVENNENTNESEESQNQEETQEEKSENTTSEEKKES